MRWIKHGACQNDEAKVSMDKTKNTNRNRIGLKNKDERKKNTAELRKSQAEKVTIKTK